MITHVKDVSEFVTWVAEVRNHFDFKGRYDFDFTHDTVDYDPWTPWFRGQCCAHWNLYPKLYRDEYGDSARRKKDNIEDEIREEFIVRAPALSESISLPDDDWGWYFLMQHFGAPTRLLDWTEAALLALYFAVKDNQGLTDAAVWALDPYKLNEKVIQSPYVFPPNARGVSTEDMKRMAPWLPERFKEPTKLPRLPIAVYSTHLARRISTQRSGFTIYGTDPGGLDRMAEEQKKVLTKAIIPGFRVQAIRRQLLACGIDESTVFPDLDGLSRSLRLKWRMDTHKLPHEGVSTRLRPSPIHNVGVFAIEEIKKGTPLFPGDIDEMLWVKESRIPKGPKEIRALYDDFSVIDKGRRYGCPKNFNRLTMSWYINEARNGHAPNVCGDRETYDFWALRDIHEGEELITKYNDYSEKPQTESKSKRKPKRETARPGKRQQAHEIR